MSKIPDTPRSFLRPGALFCLLLMGLLACGKGDGKSDVVSYFGHYHPPQWINEHPGQAIARLDTCRECHSVSGLRTGTGVPNCQTSGCHHSSLPTFRNAALHGLKAKAAVDASGGGLASCQICHGKDFSGGESLVSCESCHGVPAPHPAKPWRNGVISSHATTDPSNAAVCAQCHFPGSGKNPSGHPATPAPAGTAPGCFNNTLCHGPAQAPHPVGITWTDATNGGFHGLEAKKDLAACQACHGTPGSTKFDGGVASTKCSSCHTVAKAHPTVWNLGPQVSFPGYVPSHRNAGNQETTCSLCHDFTKGRTAPNPAAPSCYSASNNASACHFNGPGQPNHSVPFTTIAHTGAVQASFDADCAICHAVSGTSPSRAPLCTTCHQAGSPLVQKNCSSCHGKPPAGTAFPDVASAHGKHDALATVSGACATCHEGSDSGTQVHYDHANGRPGNDALRVAPGEVKMGTVFNASATGVATFNAGAQTCSNVSCHGGNTTPPWQVAGSILSTQESGCRQCHTLGTAQGAPAANSPFSGLHALHLNSTAGLQCVECHAMTNGSQGALNHFKFLNTPQMEGPAGQTVAFSTATATAKYDTASQSCGSGGAFSCHGHNHPDTYTWKGGGASHAIPYTDTGHTGVNNATSFNSNCTNCHDVAAPTTKIGPSCSTCHQAGSPLTQANCTSCHAKPPSGTAFPDVAGKHAIHDSLTGITGQCVTCHTNAEPGNANLVHYDHANGRPNKDALRVAPGETAIPAAFSGKAGAATFNPAAYTCSNVSCHGGLTTPDWRTGSIAVNTDAGCRACHTVGSDPAKPGIPESNSAYSGLHTFHLAAAIGAACTDCHSMSAATPGAQNHFKALGTAQMEGPAKDTILLPAGGTYDAVAQTCTLTCHNAAGSPTNHVAFGWLGGANHTVPYATHGSLVQNQTAFDASCKACHAVTGTSPMSLAPLCTTCHTASSPFTLQNCSSCHGKPPTGAAFPDIAGSHAAHNAVPSLTGSCVDCHSGAEPGNANLTHYNHANNRPGRNTLRVAPGEVAFPGTQYNAKTGAASFNTTAQTCSNVSCHGGQVTPAWGGSIDVTTQCTACHIYGTTQYNGFSSGEHQLHVVQKKFACTECHLMSNGKPGSNAHFTSLGTAAMEGPARDTITFAADVTGARLYAVGTTKTCTLVCHGQDHNDTTKYKW